ncbi:hypothetical protein Tco_0572865 [Tanacetum coccineum]
MVKEVNEIRAERIAKNANPLALNVRKPKRLKRLTYHKEKDCCATSEKGVPLQAEQADWLEDTDEEIDEQELEAHYSYMAKIQEVPTADSGTDTEPLEQIVQLILFIVDSRCTKHMTGNLTLLCNFVEKYLGNDLLTGNCGSDLYTISLQETTSSTPICLMAKASSTQAWL